MKIDKRNALFSRTTQNHKMSAGDDQLATFDRDVVKRVLEHYSNDSIKIRPDAVEAVAELCRLLTCDALRRAAVVARAAGKAEIDSDDVLAVTPEIMLEL
eukprot:TRINITY_DN513_c0_g1_i1.p1 TRINITY_DN513_c0_g1~~TRINITY_DN513_c0_g1_i1.p1  ORF type:complete len:100 (-),score=22.28 TRINITY_DN513_c0_g1_i1:39-338(-)